MNDAAMMKALAIELRIARKAVDLSRPELVRKMATGMPVTTYSGYEQGLRLVPLSRLVEICDALEVSPGELVNRALGRVDVLPGQVVAVVVVEGGRVNLLQAEEAFAYGLLAINPE